MTRMATRTGVIPQWTLTDRLAKARLEAGMEQDELAEMIGVSRQSVSNWERGYARPKRAFIWAWAEATGIDRHWLVYGEPAPSQQDDAGEMLPRLDSNQQPFGFGPPSTGELKSVFLKRLGASRDLVS